MAGGRRILVHDYSGHPFQVQLSRCLAARGNRVRHIHSESFQTPKGDLKKRCDDPLGLEIAGVFLDDVFRKDSFFKRRAQEVEIGRLVAAQVRRFRPEIVLSSNAPLDTQAVIYKATRAIGAKFVFWLQDIYSEAIGRILPRKLPLIGSLVAKRYHKLEYELLRRSDHIVAITDDFLPILEGNGLSRRRVSVIENWAPLDELSHAGTRHTEAKGRPIRAVYAGTLGYKHNPDILLSAAKALPVEIEVFSEGRVAGELLQRAITEGITNLHVRPWVPFSELPAVLAEADILIAMIEGDAGIFSVPSKVLTYLCFARPVLAAIPKGNLARRILEREQAGLVSDPRDHASFVTNFQRLVESAELRRTLGVNGRAYADRTFDIDRIADRFEEIFRNLTLTELQAI
ncbi:glycosyltransferase family 4 protein [Rhizobium cauense]|uniref:glycosyltransferase family 4 protein n=1 Tax=Rhizobium cauense TaxID=1166683 RepID=UPI001C6EE2E9|nr:glycosyltransferase family 4 protein [Rhizobium cauense]MBW9117738.1 glycosyltransferase family 4 protein [Rhizobium cauense]